MLVLFYNSFFILFDGCAAEKPQISKASILKLRGEDAGREQRECKPMLQFLNNMFTPVCKIPTYFLMDIIAIIQYD